MRLPAGQVRLPGSILRTDEAYAFHDSGERDAPLVSSPAGRVPRAMAIVYHSAESAVSNTRAVSGYLRKEHGANPNGVSATFVIESDGAVIQMLGLDRVSGSINPTYPRPSGGRGLCESEWGMFGASHAKGVLGYSNWRRVNHHVISVEMGMVASRGPGPKVVDAAVALFFAVRKVWPNIVPLGHADFANCYKSCPGQSWGIKSMFARMGGHGLDYTREPIPKPEEPIVGVRNFHPDRLAAVAQGTPLRERIGGDPVGKVEPPLERQYLGDSKDGNWSLVGSTLLGGSALWVPRSSLSGIREETLPQPDPEAVQKARQAGRQDGWTQALETTGATLDAAWESIPADVPNA